MKLEKVGQWMAIVANVGVLVGFLLVASQLQLNTVALQTTSAHKTNELFASADIALMGDSGNAALAKALLEPEEVTPEEAMQIWSYNTLGFYAASQVYADYKNGVITRERWLYTLDLFINYFNHPVGLLFWESGLGAFSDPTMNDFTQAVQSRLDETPKNLTQKQFREVMEGVAALKAKRAGT